MKRRLLSICLMCILVLSGCGKGETEEQDIQIPAEPENTKYKMEELILPDFFSAQEEEHEFEYEEEKDALFDGFVSDLQGKPAVYASSFTLEEEEYLADIARWTLKENKDWKEDHLCQNSLSEFLNLKYEQEHWTRFTLDQFRRGDDGSLYGIFCYYIEGKSEVDGEMVEMVTQHFSILQMDEENDQVFETPLPDFSYSMQKYVFGVGATSLERKFTDYHVFEDGKMLFLYNESGGESGKIIDGETGEVLNDLGNFISGRRRFAFGESEIIIFSNEDKKFRVLGIPELEEDNVFGTQLGEDVIGKDWFFYTNPDTWELYICNETGVYSVLSYLDSDEVRSLTGDTDITSLSERSDGEEGSKEGASAEGPGDGRSQAGNAGSVKKAGGIVDFFVESEDSIYICLREMNGDGVDDESYRIVHYEKEEK